MTMVSRSSGNGLLISTVSGPGAEGAAIRPTLAKFDISPLASHGKIRAENRSCLFNMADVPQPLRIMQKTVLEVVSLFDN